METALASLDQLTSKLLPHLRIRQSKAVNRNEEVRNQIVALYGLAVYLRDSVRIDAKDFIVCMQESLIYSRMLLSRATAQRRDKMKFPRKQ